MRKEVKWFAERMEEKLASKDELYPNGWSEDDVEGLMFLLNGKVDDLYEVTDEYRKFELVIDIANYSMMIADLLAKDEG